MKKALIYSLLLIILNLSGDMIINWLFSEYHKVSDVINYFIIFVIASLYYISNLSNKKLIGLLLLPSIFLVSSLTAIFFDFILEGLDSPIEILFLIACLISSFFELINYFIGEIQNDSLREIIFAMFNSLGISAILLVLAYLTNHLALKIRRFDNGITQTTAYSKD
jgi:hypothetical protein